jgi:hypothetical protein
VNGWDLFDDSKIKVRYFVFVGGPICRLPSRKVVEVILLYGTEKRLPFCVMSLEPQMVCFAFQSPAAMKRGPRVLK